MDDSKIWDIAIGILIPIGGLVLKRIYQWLKTKVYFHSANFSVSGYWMTVHDAIDKEGEILEILRFKETGENQISVYFQTYSSKGEKYNFSYAGNGTILTNRIAFSYFSLEKDSKCLGIAHLQLKDTNTLGRSFLEGIYYEPHDFLSETENIPITYSLFRVNDLPMADKIKFSLRKKLYEDYDIAKAKLKNYMLQTRDAQKDESTV